MPFGTRIALIPCALLIASLISPSLIAQTTITFEETTLSGPPTANHLEDIFFFDENEGWAVSPVANFAEGLFYTNDGGDSWQTETLPNQLIPGVAAICEFNERLWVAGNIGEVWTKTRSDSDWESKPSGVFKAFQDIFFVDDLNGWIVGDGGTILRSNDGGESWEGQTSGTANPLHAVHFINENAGCAVGDWTVLLTDDGGTTWTDVTPQALQYRGVHMASEDELFASALIGPIYHTEDFGVNWTNRKDTFSGTQSHLEFIDDTIAWIYTIGSFNVSIDGGQTWKADESIGGYLNGSFYSPTAGYVSGENRAFAKVSLTISQPEPSETNLVVVGTEFYGATEIPEDLGTIWDMDAGGTFAFTLKNDNTLRGWSSGTPFFFETASNLTNVVDIEAGEESAIALHNDGSITSWDYNTVKQDVPTRALNPLSIAAGGDFYLSLMPDGTIEAWGNNDNGQLNVPTDAGRIVQISAGVNHAVALNEEGRAWSWGFGVDGELPTPENTNRLVSVAAGLHGTVAVTESGNMIVWDASHNFTQAPAEFSDLIEATTSGQGYDHVGLKSDGSALVWQASNRGIDNIESETEIVSIDSYRNVVMALKRSGNETHDLSITGRSEGDHISVRPNKSKFDHGERVTITAFPPAGKYLSSWTDTETVSTNPLHLTMEDSLTIQPIYSRYRTATPIPDPVEIQETFNLDLGLSTTTAGAEIYYTLDGSDPDENSTLYKGPVAISDTQLLKAIAIREDYLDSQILEYTYQTIAIDTVEQTPNPSDGLKISIEAKEDWVYSLHLYNSIQASWTTVEADRPGTGEIVIFTTGPITSDNSLYRISARRQ